MSACRRYTKDYYLQLQIAELLYLRKDFIRIFLVWLSNY